MRPEGLCQWKKSNDTIGNRTRDRFVAQCLNQLRHRVPPVSEYWWNNVALIILRVFTGYVPLLLGCLCVYVDVHIGYTFFFSCGAATQRGSWPPHSWGFLDRTQRRTTVDRTPLGEWSARRRDLFLTTHNTHNKHPCPRWDSNPQSQQASGRRPTP